MFRAHSDANHAELLDDIVSAEEQVNSRLQTADCRQQTADMTSDMTSSYTLI